MRKSQVALLSLACLSAVLIAAAALIDRQPAEPVADVSAGHRLDRESQAVPDWSALGFDALQGLPERFRGDAGVTCVRHLAGRFADELVRLEVSPNFDQAGRDAAGEKFGDVGVGTCGHTSKAFGSFLIGANVDAWKLEIAEGTRLRFSPYGGGMVPDLSDVATMDHGALVFTDENGAFVFDFWTHGRQTGSFSGFAASPFNGMPKADWDQWMTKEGYFLDVDLDDSLDVGGTGGLPTREDLDALDVYTASDSEDGR